ncbi:hypothetical protein [Pseudoduganella sp. R-43]|uniref:hypothetical protein n=1 Tax=unclassified Pseudoduganella TaxID=2637179 RepID=UPI003CF5DAAA
MPALRALALAVQIRSSDIVCEPDFAIDGCAFVRFYRSGINIGRACVARHVSGNAFYSGYFGADGDEFHGFNYLAIANLVCEYKTSIDDAPDLDLADDAKA